MSFPTKLKYTKDHEWVSVDNKSAGVGVTKYALEQLGDIVHLELPKVGAEFSAGDSFGTIESTKTVSDLYMPIAGKVLEVNQKLLNSLETLAEDPYEGGWLVKVALKSEAELKALMDAKSYEGFIAEQGG